MGSAHENYALELRGIEKSFGSNRVLRNVDLTIGEGEFIVLLGPSGCGKTTLLRAVSGLLEPDAGKVILRGRDITRLPTNKRDMGIVFQSYALFPHMTVKENVAFGLKMRKTPQQEIDQKVEEGLRRVHLEGYGPRKITQMSGGQQQRVALARALVLNPSRLLMDEPLSNLDAKLRASVRVEIAQIQRQLGITTIMVTHDQVEAMTMADRIILLNEGVVQQDARPVDIYERPANQFVAGFVGSPSINFIMVEKKGGRVRLPELGLELPLEQFLPVLKPEDGITGLDDGQYVLGMRPEHVEIDGRDGMAAGEAQIQYVERLGSETLIHAVGGEKELVLLLPGLITSIKSRTNITLSFRRGRGHLFHGESGIRVTGQL